MRPLLLWTGIVTNARYFWFIEIRFPRSLPFRSLFDWVSPELKYPNPNTSQSGYQVHLISFEQINQCATSSLIIRIEIITRIFQVRILFFLALYLSFSHIFPEAKEGKKTSWEQKRKIEIKENDLAPRNAVSLIQTKIRTRT